jgi:secretion/DNA translocation related TadE-like protein
VTVADGDRDGEKSVRNGQAYDERGGGTMLMIGVLTVVMTLAMAGVCLAGYLVAVHRARAAADLAALSGAASVSTGDAPCPAADRVAVQNRAKVVSCGRVGDAVDFVVTVRVQVRVSTGVRGLPGTIEAVAHAGSAAE